VPSVYVPRSPTSGVLYRVVRRHLTELIAEVDAQTYGAGLTGVVVNLPVVRAEAGAIVPGGD
jgi:hypothetical protein